MSCLHDYHLKESHSDANVYICHRCGKRDVARIFKDGRMDTKRFLKEHKRKFLQPGDPLYEREFGKPKDIRIKGTNK